MGGIELFAILLPSSILFLLAFLLCFFFLVRTYCCGLIARRDWRQMLATQFALAATFIRGVLRSTASEIMSGICGATTCGRKEQQRIDRQRSCSSSCDYAIASVFLSVHVFMFRSICMYVYLFWTMLLGLFRNNVWTLFSN